MYMTVLESVILIKETANLYAIGEEYAGKKFIQQKKGGSPAGSCSLFIFIDGVQYRRKFTGETFDSGNGRSGRQHEYLSGCG